MLSQVATFFFLHLVCLLIGALLISLENLYGLETNMAATLACLLNISPELGVVGCIGATMRAAYGNAP